MTSQCGEILWLIWCSFGAHLVLIGAHSVHLFLEKIILSVRTLKEKMGDFPVAYINDPYH